eukprot:1120730-Rhodomonas_salina.3
MDCCLQFTDCRTRRWKCTLRSPRRAVGREGSQQCGAKRSQETPVVLRTSYELPGMCYEMRGTDIGHATATRRGRGSTTSRNRYRIALAVRSVITALVLMPMRRLSTSVCVSRRTPVVMLLLRPLLRGCAYAGSAAGTDTAKWTSIGWTNLVGFANCLRCPAICLRCPPLSAYAAPLSAYATPLSVYAAPLSAYAARTESAVLTSCTGASGVWEEIDAFMGHPKPNRKYLYGER